MKVRVVIDAVTARYTEALFRLATRQGIVATVQGDVDRIATHLRDPARGAYLFDARIAADKRRASIAAVLAGVSPLVRNFVNLLFDKRRENVLRNFAAAWHRRSLHERGAVEGTVESARPLGANEVNRLETALGARLRKEVKLENEVNPELLAGVRVTVENRMLDSTVQGRLDGLRRRMLDAPLSSS